MRKDTTNATTSKRKKYVWKSFSARIEKINIDVAHIVPRNNDDSVDSYFVTSLSKLSELNLTIPFTQFVQSVQNYSNTLVQVVHHQKEILDKLLQALSDPDPLCTENLQEYV